MVGDAKMRRLQKRKNAQETTLASKVSHVTDRVSTQVSPGLCQAALNQCDETEEPENQYHSPSSSKEVVQKNAPASQDSAANLIGLKKTRGPTKMKDIVMEAEDIIHVGFTDKGEPCGPGSVVTEHVPVTLEDWRKLGNDFKVVLWESIQLIMYKLQARFDLEEEWQKAAVFKSMRCLWRASKSRLVSQIQEAKNKEERLHLQPKNIQSIVEWKRFIKATNPAFKAISSKFKVQSSKFKARRRKQVPHTCSRKGMVRLREDMKKESANSSSVSRTKVWIRSHTKKNGEPVNTEVSETIENVKSAEINSPSFSTTNVREYALSKILGPDKPG